MIFLNQLYGQLVPTPFDPINDPLVFGVFYPVKYYGGFIYFISHATKNLLKNAATQGQHHLPAEFIEIHSTVARALDAAVLKFYESLEVVLVELSCCFSVTSSSSATLRQVQLAVDKIS